MQIYGCPEELPAPKIDFENFDLDKMQEQEEAHMRQLKTWLQTRGYNGKYTGEIVHEPMADGRAQYMVGDTGKKMVLIHLPYGDAWHSPNAKFWPKKEIVRRIEADKKLAAMFSKKG